MKYLFDQNISHRIFNYLPARYSDSSHVKKEGLIDYSDIEIREFAKNHGFVIVTQDSDFNELNSFYGFPPKIIWIRTGNLPTNILAEILISNEAEIQLFLEDNHYGCFEIMRILR